MTDGAAGRIRVLQTVPCEKSLGQQCLVERRQNEAACVVPLAGHGGRCCAM